MTWKLDLSLKITAYKASLVHLLFTLVDGGPDETRFGEGEHAVRAHAGGLSYCASLGVCKSLFPNLCFPRTGVSVGTDVYIF